MYDTITESVLGLRFCWPRTDETGPYHVAWLIRITSKYFSLGKRLKLKSAFMKAKSVAASQNALDAA